MKCLRFYEFAQDIASVSVLAFLTLSFASDIFSVLILAPIYPGTQEQIRWVSEITRGKGQIEFR